MSLHNIYYAIFLCKGNSHRISVAAIRQPMTDRSFDTLPARYKNPKTEFLGHPKGLWVLFWTEGWLSFAQYGMLSILVVYLKDILQHTDRARHILGLPSLLSINDSLYAPSGLDATVGSLSGLIMAVIFAAPFVGSFMADHGLGRTRSAVIGISLLTVSFTLMMAESCFVLALWLFLAGVALSGSLKAQVGALYTLEDRRRSDAYQLYSQSIQIMAIISPLLCAFLGTIAWRWAFMATACAMMMGLAGYLMGCRYLPEETASFAVGKGIRPVGCTVVEKKRIVFLLWLVGLFALGVLPNQEIMDGYLLWGSDHYRLTVMGITCPVSTLVSLDSVISMITGFLVLWFWRWYDHRRGRPVHDMTKIIIGSAIATAGPLFLIAGEYVCPAPHQISLWWGVAFHTVNDIGCGMTFPIGMALFSRYAPARHSTTLISCFTLHIFLGNLMVGKLAGMLHQIPDALFWSLHSGAAFLSTLGLMASSRIGSRLFLAGSSHG